jgi:hypothetical protein
MFQFFGASYPRHGDVKLTADITARSPGTDAGGDKLLSYAAAVANVPSHQRHAVRIRYEHWQSMTRPSPRDGGCFNPLRLGEIG